MQQHVTLKIDGVPVRAVKGASVLDAAMGRVHRIIETLALA